MKGWKYWIQEKQQIIKNRTYPHQIQGRNYKNDNKVLKPGKDKKRNKKENQPWMTHWDQQLVGGLQIIMSLQHTTSKMGPIIHKNLTRTKRLAHRGVWGSIPAGDKNLFHHKMGHGYSLSQGGNQ